MSRRFKSASLVVLLVLVVFIVLLPVVEYMHIGGKDAHRRQQIRWATDDRPDTAMKERNTFKWLQGIAHSPAADALPVSGKLFCFVETSSKFYSTRVPAVWSTWLPRCEHGRFFTPTPLNDPSIPYSTVYAGLQDSYKDLFNKSIWSFYYTFRYITDQFDWYFKADDDTYVIMEHLTEYLDTLDPEKPYYLGYTLRPGFKRGYNGGGAGYVLSREAVRLLVEKAFHNTTSCPWDKYEDTGVGRCLESVGVTPHDTRDISGRSRFNTFRADEMFENAVGPEWHYHRPIGGRNWASPQLITLHHMSPNEMLLYDDLLYRIRPPLLSSKHAEIRATRNATHSVDSHV